MMPIFCSHDAKIMPKKTYQTQAEKETKDAQNQNNFSL